MFVFLNLLLVTPAFLLPFPVGWFYLLVPIAANAVLVWLKWRDIGHYRRLVARIETQMEQGSG